MWRCDRGAGSSMWSYRHIRTAATMHRVYEVTVQPFDHTFICEDGETILEAALRNKVYLRYGCRNGGCGTCKVELVDGDVDLNVSFYSLPPGERDKGIVLVCRSFPVDDCVIDVTRMDLDSDRFHRGDSLREYRTTVEEVRVLTADIRAVRLRHEADNPMPFVAGQFVNVRVPGTELTRSYSMANPAADDDRIDLICKLLPGGRFSDWLTDDAASGSEVVVSGPFGAMAVRVSHREIVMAAGGSGLAPLLSMLAGLARKESKRVITLFFGARTAADLYATDEIEAIAAALPNFRYIPVLQDPPPDWSGAIGLVTDAISADRVSYEGCDTYLCGPPLMIDAAVAMLTERGVRPQNVHFDAFVSTGDALREDRVLRP